MSHDRTLPHNLEAEKSVLGSILIDNAQFRIAAELMDDRDFFRDAHRRIWNKMADLAERETAIDLVTLKDALARTAELDEVGGPAYIASLTDGVPRASNVDYYAKILRSKSSLRNLIHASKRILERAYDDEESPADVIGAGIKELIGLEASTSRHEIPSHLKHMSEIAGEIEAEWTAGPPDFLKMPWSDLNHRLEGGMVPGEYIVLGGRPGDGKTAMLGQIATRIAARENRTVVLISREMKRTRIFGRLIASEGSVHVGKIRRRALDLAEEGRVKNAMGRLAALPMFISHAPASLESLRELVYVCREQGSPIGLLGVDYMQLIEAPRTIRERRHQVEAISAGLKALTTDFGLPVIALSSVSRPHDANALPTMSCFRETGSIESDVDTALILHSPEGPDSDVRNLVIGKARDGSPGVMQLMFRRLFQRFEQLDHFQTAEGEP